MTRLHEQTTVSTPIEQAFAFTADFANIEQWDPGVAESSQIGAGDIAVGTEFDVLVAFGKRRIPMVYTITEFDAPHRVVLEGVGDNLTAVDEITFEDVDDGTLITYTADLSFSAPVRWFTPFMGRIFEGIGRKAVDGLSAELTARSARAA